MFRHVVMFRWVESVDTSQVASIAAALDALAGAILVIRSYVHGPDAGLSPTNFDYVVVADFDSVDDFVTYRDHPDHQSFIREHITAAAADRFAVQYTVA